MIAILIIRFIFGILFVFCVHINFYSHLNHRAVKKICMKFESSDAHLFALTTEKPDKNMYEI
jgi:hypothetical protein